jgi:hypothetical protein
MYTPLYHACLYVDKTSFDTVLSDPEQAEMILINSKFTEVEDPLVLDEYDIQEIAEGEHSFENIENQRENEAAEGCVMCEME